MESYYQFHSPILENQQVTRQVNRNEFQSCICSSLIGYWLPRPIQQRNNAMFGFLCSVHSNRSRTIGTPVTQFVICTCLLLITDIPYFEMENNKEEGNCLSKPAKRRLKLKKRSVNIRCSRSVVQMRDGLLIPHGLGYCYFCKETVDLTLILNHYGECVRKKQLSSVPRVDIVFQEQRKWRSPKETTNQPAKSLVILVRGKIVGKIAGTNKLSMSSLAQSHRFIVPSII